jgi:hypothetical protein
MNTDKSREGTNQKAKKQKAESKKAESRKQKAESRKQKAESRKQKDPLLHAFFQLHLRFYPCSPVSIGGSNPSFQ